MWILIRIRNQFSLENSKINSIKDRVESIRYRNLINPVSHKIIKKEELIFFMIHTVNGLILFEVEEDMS